uniref:Uncharacterized protein n=1 Tax=Candidatus Kentrum sp. FM TaxID=2126340 RepID=A0A450T258_9GAMM|nr:MAG: hypothetical protein BECKFM1743C_GA0114222_1011910 [Candidatus Kentron sp. FM]VFJ60593.1 MAG: hypothetical protein BECKFM1743A_GA0114220_1026710 [Candidatus Kentron sp. FM]VFK13010.1 MAG: hypothetical protein BECKFM1743B_GA0114221_1026310 [Candidatus Kentron sp. FM]
MLNKLLALSILPLALLFCAKALADDCFCLIDEDDRIWFDCRVLQDAEPTQAKYSCTDPKATDGWSKVPEALVLKPVPDGEPPCTPCRLADVNTRLRMPYR